VAPHLALHHRPGAVLPSSVRGTSTPGRRSPICSLLFPGFVSGADRIPRLHSPVCHKEGGQPLTLEGPRAAGNARCCGRALADTGTGPFKVTSDAKRSNTEACESGLCDDVGGASKSVPVPRDEPTHHPAATTVCKALKNGPQRRPPSHPRVRRVDQCGRRRRGHRVRGKRWRLLPGQARRRGLRRRYVLGGATSPRPGAAGRGLRHRRCGHLHRLFYTLNRSLKACAPGDWVGLAGTSLAQQARGRGGAQRGPSARRQAPR